MENRRFFVRCFSPYYVELILKMKKILLISPQPFFQWRGSPIRVNVTVLALTELGYDVDLLTLPIGEDRPFNNAQIIRVANPLNLKNIPIGPSLAKIVFDVFLFAKAFRLCLKNKYTVIHGIEEAGFIAVVLAKMFCIPSIYEKHSDPFSHKKGMLRNFILHIYAGLEKMVVKMSGAVLCTGSGLVEQVKRMESDTRAFHVFDIPSSIQEADLDEIVSVREMLQNSPDEILIAFVGSFTLYQGVDLMFAAILHVVKECPHGRFIIIGGSRKEIAERKAVLKKEGVEQNVTFLGKLSPDILPNYLSAADILLSPRSSGVNTPLKILDYMKAGRSIVATDIQSNRFLLSEENGMLMEATPSEFAKGIVSLIKDEKKREKMGLENRKIYKSKYTFSKFRQRIADCYEYVLAPEGTTICSLVALLSDNSTLFIVTAM